ncbi:hypothetical protein PG993_000081 [Apiospora rasikravindrae]|uniref:Methyltransferase n=1 Tax=Apiospora rasikravindrae TaxID=990691 RepID=A0ABR1U7J3_9PEZI
MTGHSIPDPASVEENGRTYSGYREGRYLLPNDGAEQDRLDLQHKVWRLLLDDALQLAPWEEAGEEEKKKKKKRANGDGDGVVNVLDIDTGTGIWPIEFAHENPAARVVGTDLSLIQPPPDKVPPNCRFVREDSEEDEWVHEVQFDYIHMRAIVSQTSCQNRHSSFTDHRAMIKKVYDNLRPGGWFESQDFSFDMVAADAATEAMLPDSAIKQWQQLMFEGMKTLGRDLRVARYYGQWLKDAGFIDVEQELLLCPLNPWPLDPKDQETGRYFETDILESLEGMSMKILQLTGLSADAIRALVARVGGDVRNRQMHAYTPVYVTYGRKPFVC